jgi:hypothetical protein
MVAVTTFPSLEALEKLLGMGMEEEGTGFATGSSGQRAQH